jgi:hypothetical protein
MTLIELKDFLIWGVAINYAILLLWFLVFVFAHDALYRMHSRWFNLTVPTFDALHYVGMTIYKVGILLLFLVPWLALTLSGK